MPDMTIVLAVRAPEPTAPHRNVGVLAKVSFDDREHTGQIDEDIAQRIVIAAQRVYDEVGRDDRILDPKEWYRREMQKMRDGAAFALTSGLRRLAALARALGHADPGDIAVEMAAQATDVAQDAPRRSTTARAFPIDRA